MFAVMMIGGILMSLAGCEQKASTPDPAKRGEYLVTLGGCNDCHTPTLPPGPDGMPIPDTTRLLSGHPENVPYPTWTPADIQQRNAIALFGPMLTAAAGPWGVSFAANLTPDNETGMGEWTEQAFIQAMRTGKHQGQPNARMILPPMPWPGIAKMTDEDLKAMWAYLRSIPPVKNQVPLPVPPGN
jgi:mono/diheme cytochrome c family protein